MDNKVVQWVTRSTPLESRGAWKRFVQERKGFDDGGRVNYAIGDLVYENLPEQTGDAKLDRQRERLGNVAKDERFVKRLSKGKSKYWPFKSDSVLITQSDIDNSHLVNNLIKKNKGFLASPERFAVELFGKNKAGKPVNFKGAMRALVIAMDNFKEAENVKFATDVYKNIDAKKFSYLEMVAKSIAQSKNAKTVAESGAAFLPENMVTHYPKILARGGEKGFFNIGGKIKPADKKFLIDRITQLTGEPIDLKQLDNTLKFATESRTAEGRIRGQIRRLASMNTDIRKLYDDPQISKLIKGDLDNKTRQKILDRAVDLVGDDVAIASRRLFQMAESLAGTRPIEGIVENKKLGNKLIDTQRIIGKNVKDGRAFSSLVYNHYAKAIDNALGAGPGKSFIGYYQTKIKNALDAGMVPDEIFSVTASARRGMHPYAIFTQALDADVNSSIKGANLDGLLSGTHERLQKIFKGRTYDKLNAADKKEVQKLVSTFENAKKNVLKDLKPEIRKNIQLPEFDLKNPPSKSIANYKSYDKNLQRAFDTSYKNVGYSMKVPKDFQTQKQFLKKTPSAMQELMSRTSMGIDPTLLPKAAYQELVKPAAKFAGKAVNVGLGPTGLIGLNVGLGVDPTQAMDRIGIAGEAALAKPLVQGSLSVTDKIKTPLLRKIAERASLAGMSPAMALRAARIASPLGLASLGVEGLYHLGKAGYNQYKLMQDMSEDERREFLAQQYEDLGGVAGEGA